jgi:hypothetical protein
MHQQAGVQAASIPEASEDAMDIEAADPEPLEQQELRSTFQCVELLCSCSGGVSTRAESAPLSRWEKNQAAICSPAAIAALCKFLTHADVSIRLVVAQVFRVLGRSQNAFTKDNLGEGLLANALFETLHDRDRAVCTTACYAVSNFLTNASSPARQTLLDRVRLPQPSWFVHLAHEHHVSVSLLACLLLLVQLQTQ